MTITYQADAEVGSALQFIKIVATTTVLSDVSSAADTARNAIASLVSLRAQPLIVGSGYTVGSTSVLLFVVPDTANLSTLQADIQATALTGLAGATVTVTPTLVG